MPSKNQTASEFSGIPDPRADVQSLAATVGALKQNVEVLTGIRGTGNNQYVTVTQYNALLARVQALETS
jgi:hypothetical protein